MIAAALDTRKESAHGRSNDKTSGRRGRTRRGKSGGQGSLGRVRASRVAGGSIRRRGAATPTNTSSCSGALGPTSRIIRNELSATLAQERREALAAFARELLPVLDNLQRALDAALEQADEGPLSRGVALVRSQMLDVLGRSGILPIEAMGRPFDPHFHESLGQQPRSDVTPDTVIEVLEPGYRFHDRVLRPARVIVAAPAESDGRESA